MSRYAWLQEEIQRVPRKKFYLLAPSSTADMTEIQKRYGPLPSDYLEFVLEFGGASFFRAQHSAWHYLSVFAPPKVRTMAADAQPSREESVQLEIGYFINTGDAWFESRETALLAHSPVFVGLVGQRRRAAHSFEEWLRRKFQACKKLYTRQEWQEILAPVSPFDLREQRILEAMSQFEFHKAGVTPDGDILVEIENHSSQSVRYLTVGVRDGSMTGSSMLPAADIGPGTSRTILSKMYNGSMDPHEVELFRLPLPDPEDRPYYGEFRTADIEGLPSR